MKKLSPAERKLDQFMLDILKFAHGKRIWRDIGNDENNKAAVELLRKRGLVEVNEVTNQFRVKK